MTASSKDRVPGRDKGKIMRLKMHSTTKIWDVLHSTLRQKIQPATSEIEQTVFQVVLRDRLRLRSLLKIATTSLKKNNSGRRQEGED